MLAAERLSEAKTMYNNAVKIYGTNSSLSNVGKEIDVVNVIANRKANLLNQLSQAGEKPTFDEKIAAYDTLLTRYASTEA